MLFDHGLSVIDYHLSELLGHLAACRLNSFVTSGVAMGVMGAIASPQFCEDGARYFLYIIRSRY